MKIKGLSNNQLKIIAMVSMLIDHIGLILLPDHIILRIIGRISFPIFAYMIAEGCIYTRNKRKHLITLLSLGILCQSVFSICTGFMYLNVLITFSLSIMSIFAIDHFSKNTTARTGIITILTLSLVFFLCVVAPRIFHTIGFGIDYGLLGVMLPVAVYFIRNKAEKLCCTAIILLLMSVISGYVQLYSLLSIPFLLLYNGKLGKMKLKYLFYIFYPTHLALIYGISLIV